MDKRTNKQNVNTQGMEYYSALKRQEILIYATTWMELKDNMENKMWHIQWNIKYVLCTYKGMKY